MVDLLVVEAIAPCRTAGRVQIGGIAVDQLRAQKRERGQKGMGTAMHQLDRVVTGKGLACASRSMPIERTPVGLRFISAPPPRWLSM